LRSQICRGGTAALHIACLAAGLGKGDEGITSPITFAASSNAMLYCGAKPVFADVDQKTICIDPKEVKKKISKKTKVVIPVHFAGHPCDMKEIKAIAEKHNLLVIEDAAHALGAKYYGTKIGSCKYSDMTVLSFHPVKHIATGEGGMVLTNNNKLYEKLKMLRTHGITRETSSSPGGWYYEMQMLGFNYRLTDIQSALGISQMKKLSCFLKRRREIAQKYNDAFSEVDGIKIFPEKKGMRSAWHLYVIGVADRRRVFIALREKGILVNVHYIPVYRQPYYRENGYKGTCPRAEIYYEQAISIPMYPKMTDKEVNYVIDAIIGIVNE